MSHARLGKRQGEDSGIAQPHLPERGQRRLSSRSGQMWLLQSPTAGTMAALQRTQCLARERRNSSKQFTPPLSSVRTSFGSPVEKDWEACSHMLMRKSTAQLWLCMSTSEGLGKDNPT